MQLICKIRTHFTNLFYRTRRHCFKFILDIRNYPIQFILAAAYCFFDCCFHWVLCFGVLVCACAIRFEQRIDRHVVLNLVKCIFRGFLLQTNFSLDERQILCVRPYCLSDLRFRRLIYSRQINRALLGFRP